MSKITYTKEQLNEFRKLIDLGSSNNQAERSCSRVQMNTFITKTGRSVCDAMFKEIEGEG